MSGLALVLALSVPGQLEYQFDNQRQELTIQVNSVLFEALIAGDTKVSVLPATDQGVQLITLAGLPAAVVPASGRSPLKETIEPGADGEIALELTWKEFQTLREGGELRFRVLNENREAKRFAFWLAKDPSATAPGPITTTVGGAPALIGDGQGGGINRGVNGQTYSGQGNLGQGNAPRYGGGTNSGTGNYSSVPYGRQGNNAGVSDNPSNFERGVGRTVSNAGLNRGNLGQGNLTQGNLGQGNLGQGNLGQGNLGQGNLGQGNLGRGSGQGTANIRNTLADGSVGGGNYVGNATPNGRQGSNPADSRNPNNAGNLQGGRNLGNQAQQLYDQFGRPIVNATTNGVNGFNSGNGNLNAGNLNAGNLTNAGNLNAGNLTNAGNLNAGNLTNAGNNNNGYNNTGNRGFDPGYNGGSPNANLNQAQPGNGGYPLGPNGTPNYSAAPIGAGNSQSNYAPGSTVGSRQNNQSQYTGDPNQRLDSRYFGGQNTADQSFQNRARGRQDIQDNLANGRGAARGEGAIGPSMQAPGKRAESGEPEFRMASLDSDGFRIGDPPTSSNRRSGVTIRKDDQGDGATNDTFEGQDRADTTTLGWIVSLFLIALSSGIFWLLRIYQIRYRGLLREMRETGNLIV